MRRLFVLLVFLIVIGGVVFYFGWIQIKLDQDSYAVIFTKTGGWEEDVIVPGEFTWRAARLLPTNLTLHVFPVVPHRTTATLRGSLPSAGVYSAIFDIPSPFSYSVSVDIVYRLDPDKLPELARDTGLREDDLAGFYSRTDSEAQQVVLESILRQVEQTESVTVPASAMEVISRSSLDALERRFTSLEFLSVSPTRIELPDLRLYQEARNRYTAIMDARTEAMSAAAAQTSSAQAETDAALARLERYGEILDHYPILLEYFSLSQEFPAEALDLEALIPADR